MRSLVHRVDDRVDELFDAWRGNAIADRTFYTASAVGDFGLLWIVLALLRGRRGRPNDKRAGARAIVATVIESVVVNGVVKSFFGRHRPPLEVEHPHPFRVPLTSSFPSGHTSAAFCAATLLADGDNFAPLYFALAGIVAASRIHVRIHHASDVLAGMVVGLALGQIGKQLSPLPEPPVTGIRS